MFKSEYFDPTYKEILFKLLGQYFFCFSDFFVLKAIYQSNIGKILKIINLKFPPNS